MIAGILLVLTLCVLIAPIAYQQGRRAGVKAEKLRVTYILHDVRGLVSSGALSIVAQRLAGHLSSSEMRAELEQYMVAKDKEAAARRRQLEDRYALRQAVKRADAMLGGDAHPPAPFISSEQAAAALLLGAIQVYLEQWD